MIIIELIFAAWPVLLGIFLVATLFKYLKYKQNEITVQTEIARQLGDIAKIMKNRERVKYQP